MNQTSQTSGEVLDHKMAYQKVEIEILVIKLMEIQQQKPEFVGPIELINQQLHLQEKEQQ